MLKSTVSIKLTNIKRENMFAVSEIILNHRQFAVRKYTICSSGTHKLPLIAVARQKFSTCRIACANAVPQRRQASDLPGDV